MSERDDYEPGVRAGSPRLSPTPAAIDGSVVAGPYDVPRFRKAVLADPHGAAFTVSLLVIASQGV